MAVIDKLLRSGLKPSSIKALDDVVYKIKDFFSNKEGQMTASNIIKELENIGITKELQDEIGFTTKLDVGQLDVKTIQDKIAELEANIRPGGVSPDEVRKRIDEQGYSDVLYHGTNKDVEQFKPTVNGTRGTGSYTTADTEAANRWAMRSGLTNRGTNIDTEGMNVMPVRGRGMPKYGSYAEQVWEPEQLRSVNAEYNPDRKLSKNILAGGTGAALLNQLTKEQAAPRDYQTELKQLFGF